VLISAATKPLVSVTSSECGRPGSVQGQPFPAPGSAEWPAGHASAYRDGFAEIWELPSPAPVSHSDLSSEMAPLPATTQGVPRPRGRVGSGYGPLRLSLDPCPPGQYLRGWTASDS